MGPSQRVSAGISALPSPVAHSQCGRMTEGKKILDKIPPSAPGPATARREPSFSDPAETTSTLVNESKACPGTE